MADALDSGSSVLWGVRVQLPPSAPALYEGIAQVLIRLDDSLSHPSFMQGSHLIASSGFVGSRLVSPAQFVVLSDTYLTPTRGSEFAVGGVADESTLPLASHLAGCRSHASCC